MARQRYCRTCGIPFTYSRDDQQWCSPKCVAKFYRDNPNPPYVHAANMSEFWHECEQCGVEYFVNGFAERGGKRRPKFCSVKCKQAAYRARHQTTQQQAARRNTPPPPPPPKASSTPPPPPDPNAPNWSYVGTRNHFSSEALREARKILGVDQNSDAAAIRKAFKAAMLRWHPDRNSSPYATQWAQAINWAYEALK